MVAMQRYINKKAVKGYRLKSIVPFILFPPLHFIAFTFKKSATNKIRYLVEYQRFEDDDLKKKYIQHMKDQGWTLFTNVPINNDALVFLYRSRCINFTNQSHQRRFDERCSITISTWLYFDMSIYHLLLCYSSYKSYRYIYWIYISLFLFDCSISYYYICIY